MCLYLLCPTPLCTGANYVETIPLLLAMLNIHTLPLLSRSTKFIRFLLYKCLHMLIQFHQITILSFFIISLAPSIGHFVKCNNLLHINVKLFLFSSHLGQIQKDFTILCKLFSLYVHRHLQSH